MSFPNPDTYVPTTAPAKRGPSLRVRIPQLEHSSEAKFKGEIFVPNLTLSAAVNEASKQPLPEYAEYSRERAQVSSFAMEHSGDNGKMDYLHWKLFHNGRPAGPWDVCPCESDIFESPDADEESRAKEELERRLNELQQEFGSPNYAPNTAEINNAIWNDLFGSPGKSSPSQRVSLDLAPLALEDKDEDIAKEQTNDCGLAASQTSDHAAALNPAVMSFEMPEPDFAVSERPHESSQPDINKS
ncbi:uncharacterized protein CTRU02_210443 [Colletotrichum truncatum]|uniref:Uncharacterized protein n=1 Tax=Colletotrichum truncatum TaxID=5467 RepID=A0ACC3YP16_COLTU|nr:uncharacterized protein CTRU02_13956 [Colletotrichum truncatum]KAF6782799.1 hypothetical protein CTRU02_13956 [Colletotrichum truncatum]